MTKCTESGCRNLEKRCIDCGRLVCDYKLDTRWLVPSEDEKELHFKEIKESGNEYYSGLPWISVKDKFPPECEDILIYAEGCSITGAFLTYNWDGNPVVYHINDWDESDSIVSLDSVTHWMPLPPTDYIVKK